MTPRRDDAVLRARAPDDVARFRRQRTSMQGDNSFDIVARLGTLTSKPKSCSDLFFPVAQGLPGD